MDVRVDGGEVQITMDQRDAEDLLEDLKAVRRYLGCLAPRTEDLEDLLYEKGIK